MRKQLVFLILGICLLSLSVAAQTQQGTIMFQDEERSMRFYVPETYDSTKAYPLVFNLHGFGSNATQQEIYSRMDVVAEENEFIVVYPEGIGFENELGTYTQFFNVGFNEDQYNSYPDDVGFVSALIDHFSANYNIDANRVYSCGMSNGGFMSYRLACELEDRIAAIASVTGVMTEIMVENCQSSVPKPVLHIHGDNDLTVPYNGADGFLSVQESMDYWISQNECSSEAITEDLEDIVDTDGTTVEKTAWTDCQSNKEVLHFKINDGGHTWPDGVFDIDGMTNRDINASEEIWKFFQQYTLAGPAVSSATVEALEVSSFPNPFVDQLQIEWQGDMQQIAVFNTAGSLVFELPASGKKQCTMQTQTWVPGIYLISLQSRQGKKQIMRTVKLASSN